MAIMKSTRAAKAQSGQRPIRNAPAPGRATVRRKPAPQSRVIPINLESKALRALMVEQSRDRDGYITVYRGSRAEFVGAGVPEAAMPQAGKGRRFQIKGPWTSREVILQGAMNPIDDDGLELEIAWDWSPSLCGAGHPAVRELARIILIELSAWGGPHPWPAGLERPRDALPDKSSLWLTFEKLAQHGWATDYKPAPGSQRLRISERFRERIWEHSKELYEAIQRECEVFADTPAPRERRQGLSLVVDNTQVRP